MNIYTSETEYLKTEVQRLRALVRAQQITIDKLEAQPVQKRPQNCGTGYCSCIECVMGPEQEPVAWEQFYPDMGKPQLEMKVEGPRHVICQCDKCKPQISFNAEVIGYVEPQRTWVGLTKNEVEILAYKAEDNTWKAVELAEAKLKEKNT